MNIHKILSMLKKAELIYDDEEDALNGEYGAEVKADGTTHGESQREVLEEASVSKSLGK